MCISSGERATTTLKLMLESYLDLVPWWSHQTSESQPCSRAGTTLWDARGVHALVFNLLDEAGLIESGPLACNTHEVVNTDGEKIVAENVIESAQGRLSFWRDSAL